MPVAASGGSTRCCSRARAPRSSSTTSAAPAPARAPTTGPAQQVVDEIEAAGGEAVANTDDISTWDGAERIVQQAIDTFGGLDVVVNNAGILRDRMMVNMTEAEWDAVIKVHLKGTFGPAHFAAAYWRDKSKAGEHVDARIINTTSPSGIFGNIGQSNYGAAKAGIAAFTVITSQELGRYGVTVNAIAPTALTRMTEDLGMMEAIGEEGRDAIGPETISPLVVWLGSSQSSSVTGRVFGVFGNKISVAEGWAYGPSARPGHDLGAGRARRGHPGAGGRGGSERADVGRP